jgi:hypothetical protein
MMQSHYNEYQSMEVPDALARGKSSLPEANESSAEVILPMNPPSRFYGKFSDSMELYAPQQKVAEYLKAHREWFRRCAHPMKVDPLGEDGYAMTIGRFGAFGYEVEPKVGLELLPPERGVYRIKTIPVPDYVAPGYDVDFQAALELLETPPESLQDSHALKDLQHEITKVEWKLDLAVYLHFPRFIHRLPKNLIQSTGDRLIYQIVRQVSRRLTHKVQEDFHGSLGLPFPSKVRKK